MCNIKSAALLLFVFCITVTECNAQMLPQLANLPCIHSKTVPPLFNSQATCWFKGINAADTLEFHYREITLPTFQPVPGPSGNWSTVIMQAKTIPSPYPWIPDQYDAHWADVAGGAPVGTWFEWKITRAGALILGPSYFSMQP